MDRSGDVQKCYLISYVVLRVQASKMAQWLSWLERRPVTAEVESSSLFWVVFVFCTKYHGIIAQLGEHLPYKQGVTGSSPVGPIYGWIPEWPKGADCKSVASCFGGSNPPLPILIAALRLKFFITLLVFDDAGWSSSEARRAHNPEVTGSNPVPATYAQVAQLVRAPPCHGGGREFESHLGRFGFANAVP